MRKVSKVFAVSEEEFLEIVNKSNCLRDIVDALGYSKNSGSVQEKVKQRILREKIDISHFYKKTKSNSKYDLKDILVENSNYTNMTSLKARLVKENILPYECVICGNNGEWNGNPLTLQLDHINGINNDHRIENLRFLCPNCHSQTDNYSGRNLGSYVDKDTKTTIGKQKHFCKNCGKEVPRKKNTGYCMDCYRLLVQRKFERPYKEELMGLLETLTISYIAKKYNTTNNNIKGWLTEYGIIYE